MFPIHFPGDEEKKNWTEKEREDHRQASKGWMIILAAFLFCIILVPFLPYLK